MKLTFLFLIASFISSSMAATIPLIVTAASGKFLIGGETAPSLTFSQGNTYVFDISDTSLSSHPFKLSTNENSGEYTTGVSTTASTVQIVVDSNTPSTLYYYCANHANMGADITVSPASSVSPASCNSAYSALGRTYDATATECTVDTNYVVTSTSQCQCTGCGQIQVYMAEAGEKCNNGTWSEAVLGCTEITAINYNPAATVDDGSCRLNAMCDTFTCPSGYLLRPNPETIPCASNTCVGLAADHTDTSGTNYGQYAPKQDKDRCCDYDNSEFTYVEHDKKQDGTWKTVAEGGTGGCLSDKCYDKSQLHGHKVCGWGSGACAACKYCTDFEATLPATNKFDDAGANCAASCRNNLYDSSKEGFCAQSSCRGCEYCTDTYYDKVDDVDVNCDAKCSKYYQLGALGQTKYVNFCLWGSCRGCQLCSEEKTDRDATKYGVKANCDAKCSKYYELGRLGHTKYDNFCLWGSCRQCTQCETEKTDRDTTKYGVKANCDAKCSKYYELGRLGHTKYDNFCLWGSCRQCTQCETEKTDRDATQFGNVGCGERCTKYHTLKALGTTRYDGFCNWGECRLCDFCANNLQSVRSRFRSTEPSLAEFLKDSRSDTEPSLAEFLKDSRSDTEPSIAEFLKDSRSDTEPSIAEFLKDSKSDTTI